MKYKNIELTADGDYNETELSCSVEFKNNDEDDEIIEEMEDKLIELFDNFDREVGIESVTDTIILVRCWDITFDKKGVKLLKKIYNTLIDAELDAKIFVNVHVDKDWFKQDDGKEYNEDVVSFDDFVQNLEY